MRILIITRNAWDDTNAIGNTISNFFGDIEGAEFAAIYFRSSLPNNPVCKKYYQTSEMEIIRKWFRPQLIGRQFCLSKNNIKQNENNVKKEKKLIHLIQKYGLKLAYKLSDSLWYSEKWINDNLDRFIEEFSPDVVFTFVKSAPQYYLIVKHIREKYNIPLFTWIADDEYTAFEQQGGKKEIRNLRYILNESATICGCSQEICDYYQSIFGCEAKPLYKSCEFSFPIKTSIGDPITIVYAGNLLYGRLDIISQVADVVENLNANGIGVSFEVFSNTFILPQEEQAIFGTKKATQYMGKRDYGFIKKRLAIADIVLHVESFDESEIQKIKYSFSTKIIDYLQSGSVILAIGPKEISSMRYLSGIPGVMVVNDVKNLIFDLQKLLVDSDSLMQRACAIRNYAEHHHGTKTVFKILTEIYSQKKNGGT